MKRKVGLLLLLLLLVSCDNHKPTRLIILLVGDQMRPDHLSRFERLYTGGFIWLLDNSVVFDSAYQQHGYTVTGPGHFAIGTGIYPGPGGVLGNEYFDRVFSLILKLNDNLNKRTLVLCTSYHQINAFKNIFKNKLKYDNKFLFQDTTISKQILLRKYLEKQ